MRSRARGLGLAVATVVGGLGLAGCAEPPSVGVARLPRSPLAHGVAQVCVMRPDALAGDVSMELRDNGRLVGATRGGTYVCWLAEPGEHQIRSIDDDTGPTWLEARANGRYWLHQEVSELGGRVHAHLDWVDAPTAAELIDACDERVRASVPGREDEPAALAIAPAKR
jgi:hypothetical protein